MDPRNMSEALSVSREPEDLTKILSEQLREFLDFSQFYIVIYKENSTEVEWAVIGREKSLVAAYADVPVEQRPSWQAYTTQEPFHIRDWKSDERVPEQLKQGIATHGLDVGPLLFVPLTTPHRRLGALGMSGPPGTVYSNDEVSLLRLIGRVVAFAIDDNFNLRQAEAARAELQRQNEQLHRSERELRQVIESIPSMAWSAAADGAAEFFNRRWLEYTGLKADQVQGGGWTVAVHRDDLNALGDYWRTVVASGQPGEIEARLRRFDGVYRWFLFRATPFFDESGKLKKWYGTNTNIKNQNVVCAGSVTYCSRLRIDRPSVSSSWTGSQSSSVAGDPARHPFRPEQRHETWLGWPQRIGQDNAFASMTGGARRGKRGNRVACAEELRVVLSRMREIDGTLTAPGPCFSSDSVVYLDRVVHVASYAARFLSQASDSTSRSSG